MIKYLTLQQVLKMHDAFIENFGGLQGIRDINLLLSAIETPKATMFGILTFFLLFICGI